MIVTKDHREIELMKEAGRIVALVHQKLKEVIVPGITTKEIDEICEKVIRENNATPSFLHLYGFPNSVCTSINEVVVHGIPSDRVLKDGDIINVDWPEKWPSFMTEQGFSSGIAYSFARSSLKEVSSTMIFTFS